jgi:hypothetical protein
MSEYKIISGTGKFASDVAKALGLDPNRTCRIILDIGIHDVIRAYVESFGDERLYNINLTNMSVEKIDSEVKP